jgi:tetratricopeptide (TPR) repeat protein
MQKTNAKTNALPLPIVHFVLLATVLLTTLASCSLNKMVMNKVADAVSGAGTNTVFMGDNDPELVGDARPFAVKMYEVLLDQNPDHPGLILTTGSLFIMYANAFVQGPAEMLPMEMFEEKGFQLNRARNLYLRGTAILERGIQQKYPEMLAEWGFGENPAFTENLSKMKKEDVPLFYWYAAGTLSAYSLNVFDISLGMRSPRIIAMAERAYKLDPDFNLGALDELFLLVYGSFPDGMGGDPEKAQFHYEQALKKSQGNSASPYVAYAQSIAVQKQDYELFKSNLEAALAIDPAANPSNTLVNTINQHKARYLLQRAPALFADIEFEDDFYYYYEYDEDE